MSAKFIIGRCENCPKTNSIFSYHDEFIQPPPKKNQKERINLEMSKSYQMILNILGNKKR